MQNERPDDPDVFRDRSDVSPVIGTRALVENANLFEREKIK
jgi:hypothetical protein